MMLAHWLGKTLNFGASSPLLISLEPSALSARPRLYEPMPALQGPEQPSCPLASSILTFASSHGHGYAWLCIAPHARKTPNSRRPKSQADFVLKDFCSPVLGLAGFMWRNPILSRVASALFPALLRSLLSSGSCRAWRSAGPSPRLITFFQLPLSSNFVGDTAGVAMRSRDFVLLVLSCRTCAATVPWPVD